MAANYVLITAEALRLALSPTFPDTVAYLGPPAIRAVEEVSCRLTSEEYYQDVDPESVEEIGSFVMKHYQRKKGGRYWRCFKDFACGDGVEVIVKDTDGDGQFDRGNCSFMDLFVYPNGKPDQVITICPARSPDKRGVDLPSEKEGQKYSGREYQMLGCGMMEGAREGGKDVWENCTVLDRIISTVDSNQLIAGLRMFLEEKNGSNRAQFKSPQNTAPRR